MTYEDYNPWLNGDASWLNGEHEGNGIKVEVNSSYSYVSITIDGEELCLQGDEADEFIKATAWRATQIEPNKTFSENIIDYVSMVY